MPISWTARVAKPKDTEVAITVTMTVDEWKRSLLYGFNDEFYRAVSEVVNSVMGKAVNNE